MDNTVLVAIIISIPSAVTAIVAASMAWNGRSTAKDNTGKIERIQITLDGYMTRIIEETSRAAAAAAIAEERRIAADRAARTAIAVAEVVAEKSATDTAAAEARSPDDGTTKGPVDVG